jgi:hypothetical protein
VRGASGNRPREVSNTSGYRGEALHGIGGGDLAARLNAVQLIADRKYRLALRAAATKSASRSFRTYIFNTKCYYMAIGSASPGSWLWRVAPAPGLGRLGAGRALGHIHLAPPRPPPTPTSSSSHGPRRHHEPRWTKDHTNHVVRRSSFVVRSFVHRSVVRRSSWRRGASNWELRARPRPGSSGPWWPLVAGWWGVICQLVPAPAPLPPASPCRPDPRSQICHHCLLLAFAFALFPFCAPPPSPGPRAPRPRSKKQEATKPRGAAGVRYTCWWLVAAITLASHQPPQPAVLIFLMAYGLWPVVAFGLWARCVSLVPHSIKAQTKARLRRCCLRPHSFGAPAPAPASVGEWVALAGLVCSAWQPQPRIAPSDLPRQRTVPYHDRCSRCGARTADIVVGE